MDKKTTSYGPTDVRQEKVLCVEGSYEQRKKIFNLEKKSSKKKKRKVRLADVVFFLFPIHSLTHSDLSLN